MIRNTKFQHFFKGILYFFIFFNETIISVTQSLYFCNHYDYEDITLST